MDNIIRLKDRTNISDKMTQDSLILPISVNQSPYLRGKMFFYDALGNLLDTQENMVVLSGAMFLLEKAWGVTGPALVDTINNIKDIANSGAPLTLNDKTVCLFGVGTGGSGDGIGTVLDPKFYEREIFDMVPLRVIEPTSLTPDELTKYWFRHDLGDGKTAYYMKRFDIDPVIKVLWKDAEGDEDGSEVQPGVYQTTRTEPIETFIEMVIKITKKDIREWFERNGEIELSRFNSIGLFYGGYGQLADSSYDYKELKLLSKLNIGNEMLTYAKELTMIYRIYTS